MKFLSNLNKKLNKWESNNYLKCMKILMGVIASFPACGLIIIFEGYFTKDILKVVSGSGLAVAGTVLATLFGVTLYNEIDDERRASIRRHPVSQ